MSADFSSSFAWRRAIRDDRRLSKNAKLVAMTLHTYMDADGIAWPSIDTLAEGASLHRRTVQYALDELERSGYIARSGWEGEERRGGRRAGGGGRGRSNYYFAVLPEHQTVADDHPSNERVAGSAERVAPGAATVAMATSTVAVSTANGGPVPPELLSERVSEDVRKVVSERPRASRADGDSADFTKHCFTCEQPIVDGTFRAGQWWCSEHCPP